VAPKGVHTQTDVPEADVPRVVAGFKAQSASVVTTKQPNGLFTVVATFPDS
jgi:hypothetical protein